ncbi:unnamed protein product [Adineta steineri]|uniref:Uncharacterized protein n=1 Tax=Adineta steineri TaxID=433720 RepID=A0A818QB36_9BILA|nr:unnamed protein product [Adineta steineri]CAF3638598.1 unnamed protein product [Adineta steineri]
MLKYNNRTEFATKINMSSNEQNYHIGPQAGSIGQAGGAFSERGRAAENAYFHAQEAEQLAALKQQMEQQQQTGNQSK